MTAGEKNIFSHRRKAGDLLITFLKTTNIQSVMMARIKIDLPESFSYSTLFAVRITDLNYGAHVGNDKVLSFLHEVRVRFLVSLEYRTQYRRRRSDHGDAALIFKNEIITGTNC